MRDNKNATNDLLKETAILILLLTAIFVRRLWCHYSRFPNRIISISYAKPFVFLSPSLKCIIYTTVGLPYRCVVICDLVFELINGTANVTLSEMIYICGYMLAQATTN